MDVPDQSPPVCPVCDHPHDSVSEHDDGLVIDLLEDERYRRVCAEPVGGPRVRFYHHTHEQTGEG